MTSSWQVFRIWRMGRSMKCSVANDEFISKASSPVHVPDISPIASTIVPPVLIYKFRLTRKPSLCIVESHNNGTFIHEPIVCQRWRFRYSVMNGVRTEKLVAKKLSGRVDWDREIMPKHLLTVSSRIKIYSGSWGGIIKISWPVVSIVSNTHKLWKSRSIEKLIGRRLPSNSGYETCYWIWLFTCESEETVMDKLRANAFTLISLPADWVTHNNKRKHSKNITQSHSPDD